MPVGLQVGEPDYLIDVRLWRLVDTYEAVDKYTVKATLSKPNSAAGPTVPPGQTNGSPS